jgi:hypothetical protein
MLSIELNSYDQRSKAKEYNKHGNIREKHTNIK